MDPILVTKVEKGPSDAPVLLVDRKGIVGKAIFERIRQELLVVFVSSVETETTENLIYIRYKNRIPEIPNDAYSLIIFVSDQEKDLHDLTTEFINKARQDKTKFIFITTHDQIQNQLIDSINTAYEESYTIILGELFGSTDLVSSIDTYIHQAATTNAIQLAHMGLRKTHPVLFTDAIQAILQSIFGIQKQHRITLLYQEHQYTDLSIAHMLQKADPLLHIDFLHDDKRSNFAKATLDKQNGKGLVGSYYFDKEYPLGEKIITIYRAMQSLKKNKVDTYVYQQEPQPLFDLEEDNNPFVSNRVKNTGLYVLYCLSVLIFIPLIATGIATLIAYNALGAAKTAIEHGDISGARSKIGIAAASFTAADMTKYPLVLGLNIVGAGTIAQQLDEKLQTGKEITGDLKNIFTAEQSVEQVISGKTAIPNVDINNAISLARTSLISLQKLNNEAYIADKIGKYQTGIDLLTGTINLLPNVLGTTGNKTYLILFANNMELRPGGGFIGSYGLVSFNNGMVGPITIHDVYDADGQLRQHVEPPFAIRRIMGNVHLYLRDSNFDVDFVKNAQQTSQMLQLETGQKVDGVISIDLTFVKYLLAAIGPIYVPEYNTSVNADNFFILTEEHAERNSFAGSTQKKDFLKSVFTALQQKVLTGKQADAGELTQKILQSIQEKHLMVALADITSQNILTANYLSSSLWDPRPDSPGEINDYMGINDANIGVNKANYFVKRNIKQSVSLDGDGTLKGEVDVQYHNASIGTQWPGGDYKNYMRIILPSDTVLTGLSFDGKTQATRSAITDPFIYETKGFIAPSELEVEKTEELGKTIYGFLVTIPASSTKTIAITYQFDKKVNLGNPVLHYNLRLFKQPGTDNDPFAFSFNYPLEYSILSSSPQDTVSSDSDYFLTTQLSQDKTISIDLTKK